MDGVHDMGGMDGFGGVVPDGAIFHAPWERRLFGLTRVSRAAGITSVRQNRFAVFIVVSPFVVCELRAQLVLPAC